MQSFIFNFTVFTFLWFLFTIQFMAKKKGIRKHVILKSTESGHAYHTEKSSRNTPDRIEILKYDPLIKKHVKYKEEK
jgi:large subunit ribosomal protein L33